MSVVCITVQTRLAPVDRHWSILAELSIVRCGEWRWRADLSIFTQNYPTFESKRGARARCRTLEVTVIVLRRSCSLASLRMCSKLNEALVYCDFQNSPVNSIREIDVEKEADELECGRGRFRNVTSVVLCASGYQTHARKDNSSLYQNGKILYIEMSRHPLFL